METEPGSGTSGNRKSEDPLLDIRNWRDRLDLVWSFEDNSLFCSGRQGNYRIFRAIGRWFLLYFHDMNSGNVSVVYRIFDDLRSSIRNAESFEEQVMFQMLLTKAIEIKNRKENS